MMQKGFTCQNYGFYQRIQHFPAPKTTPGPKSYKNQKILTRSTSNINQHKLTTNLPDDEVITVLKSITTKETNFPKNSKKVVLDFSSPNIAKPFHVGHLRSTIIGNFIANINRYYNHNVTSINYLGDWGTQFGLLKVGLKLKNINIKDLNEDPMKLLLQAYVYANAVGKNDKEVREEAKRYFSDIEQGKQDLGDWKLLREITVKELQKVYNRLGIEFNVYDWESDYNGEAIKDVISLLVQKDILKTDDSGRKYARVGVDNRPVTVLKSDNSTLYLSRDIAALLDRYERFKFDEMLYIVENSQTEHLAALFEIVGRLNKTCADACKHIKFGRIHGMSTRTGKLVFLNDILDEAKNKMYEKQKDSKNTRKSAMNEETCDILGTTAVIINDMKRRKTKDYIFSWDSALQTEGDSGIKLQYLHCRLWSLEQNCGHTLPKEYDPSVLNEPIIHDVIAELSKFEDIISRSYEQHEACIIVAYLFKLSNVVNRMFNEINIKNECSDVGSQRLLVFHAARLVVKKSLELLGIKALYEM